MSTDQTKGEPGSTPGSGMKVLCLLLALMMLIIAGSAVSVQIWGEKEETSAADLPLAMTASMSVAEFGEVNALSDQLLKEVFNLDSAEQWQKPISSFGMSLQQIAKKRSKLQVLESEEESKNWVKIPLKFSLWFLFLAVCFLLLRRNRLNKRTRLLVYGLGFTLFGVVLGAEPSPMGTVKDAIVLYASKGVIFKPRLVAFTIFTATVVVANKFICSWGCQLGTLQDFIFRLNRNSSDTARGALPQFRIPFVVSNSIRCGFFIALIWVAVAWAYDISHEINPFKIYNPLKVTTLGWAFISLTLVSSLVVYRPWCHLFCPFGLTGWLFEKLSFFRIKVDRAKCISCLACESACPSPVMGAILKQDKKVIPDCFSCGNCVETCPTGAVSFTSKKLKKTVQARKDSRDAQS